MRELREDVGTVGRVRENRWDVPVIECMDCGAHFEGHKVDRDVGRPPGDGLRILLVFCPECCPQCNNLKAASTEE